jgi:hypothetical protein
MIHPVLRTILSIAGVGSALLGNALGCGGSGSGNGATLAAGKDDFIAKYCAEYAPCCAKVNRPSDGATCRIFFSALTPPNYNAAAANDCLTEVHAAAASPTFCDGLSNASEPSCSKVFDSASGTLQPGEPCTQDEECAPSAEGKVTCMSVFNNGAEIRKCQVQIAGKAGDSPCAGTVDGNITYYSFSGPVTDVAPKAYLCDVATAVYCDSSSRKCTAIGMLGDTCTTNSGQYTCVKAAYCDFTTRTCTATKAVGEACHSFPQECSVGNYCDDATMKCAVALADGTACMSSLTCASKTCVNGKCAKPGSSDFGLALICGG